MVNNDKNSTYIFRHFSQPAMQEWLYKKIEGGFFIMAKKIVLAGACRTAIGKMGGGLSKTPAPVLGSVVIKEALNRAGVPADQVDHVYMGCVIQEIERAHV